MPRLSKRPDLAFDDAMAVHVLRAAGALYRDLQLAFDKHPTCMSGVLDGTLHPGSWDAALERLATGEPWHPLVDELVRRRGSDRVISTTRDARPSKRSFQKQLKRLRKHAIPFVRRSGPPRSSGSTPGCRHSTVDCTQPAGQRAENNQQS